MLLYQHRVHNVPLTHLDLVLDGSYTVESLNHDIVSFGAGTVGAVDTLIPRIAAAHAGLTLVPAIVVEFHSVIPVGVPELAHKVRPVLLIVVEGPQVDAVREVVGVHAAAVSGAVVRAGHTCATLAFVAVEAQALSNRVECCHRRLLL